MDCVSLVAVDCGLQTETFKLVCDEQALVIEAQLNPTIAPGPRDGDVQLALGGSTAGALSDFGSRHSSALPLMKKYMLQHLRESLRGASDELFCVPMRPGVLRQLRSLLRPSLEPGHVRASDLNLPSFDVDLDSVMARDLEAANAFAEAVRGMLFFHVVKSAPSRLIRVAAENEEGFSAADIVIAPHRVLHADAEARESVVECSAMDWLNQGDKQPFLLSLDNFECEDLLRMFQLRAGENLSHGLWGADASLLRLPRGSEDCLPELLEDLLAKRGDNVYELDVRRPGTELWKPCLAAMANAGLLRKVSDDARFSRWVLRDLGLQTIKAGYKLTQPKPVLQIRKDVELQDLSVWELIASLREKGWLHMVKNAGREPAFVPGSGPWVWYSKPGDESVSSWYLLSLLKGNAEEVPHWKRASFYQALVEGKEVAQAHRRCPARTLAIRNVDEHEWDVPTLEDTVQPQPKQRGRKRRLCQIEQAAAVMDDNEALDNDAILDAEGANANAVFEALEMPESPSRTSGDDSPADVELNDDADSSDDSSSSSNTSSSSSSKPDAAAKVRPKAKARNKAKAAAAARAVNPKASFRHGMGHLVRVYKKGQPEGWELSCQHPCHTDAKCRKNLKEITRGRTADQTLNLLKVWLIRGRHSCTAAEHMGDIWSEVERDFKNGQIEVAPEVPPMQYTGRDGLPHVFVPRA